LVNRLAPQEVEIMAVAPEQVASMEPRLSKIIQSAIDQHRGRK